MIARGAPPGNSKHKRPEVAIVASWLIPGLGQLYLGAWRPAVVLMALFFALAIPVWTEVAPYIVLVWPTLLVWLVSQVDVWRRAGVHPRDYLQSRDR